MPPAHASDVFRQLHQGGAPLLLPNAWDAGSAALIESLGAKAIATTSAGVCWARGYPDGDTLPADDLIDAARAMARVVRVPLSVDMESGYSNEPPVVAQLAARLIDAGAVGINIEDGAQPPELLERKIQAIRKLKGPALFINARVDVYLRALATGDAAIDEVAKRAERYRTAGCDGIFVPGLVDLAAMSAIARAVAPLPLNVLLRSGMARPEVLYQNGVRRLSAGSGVAQATLGNAAQLTREFLAGNGQALFGPTDVTYGTMNALFAKR